MFFSSSPKVSKSLSSPTTLNPQPFINPHNFLCFLGVFCVFFSLWIYIPIHNHIIMTENVIAVLSVFLAALGLGMLGGIVLLFKKEK